MIDYAALTNAINEIAATKGPFTLAALVQRAEGPGSWDLLVSAPWIQEGRLKSLNEFVELLRKRVSDSVVAELARIVPIKTDDPGLRRLLEDPEASAGKTLKNPVYFGVPIDEAMILAVLSRTIAQEQGVVIEGANNTANSSNSTSSTLTAAGPPVSGNPKPEEPS